MTQFQVQKDDFRRTRLVETDDEAVDVADGEIRVQVERFAFTANNITYATMGDRLGYWQFFKPAGEDADGWGLIPVWGFGRVVASGVADMSVGERLYGYFPPAHFVTMKPVRVRAERLIDGAAHRAELPAAYNSYSRVAQEPGYERSMDDERMLLWPLHITSFCLWDVLQDADWYGARSVIIVSASSKTSIGLAYALHVDANAPAVLGLTSERNQSFVNRLGLYDRVASYDELLEIDASIPTAVVDMSGNGDVLGRLHRHLGENMVRCINVGLTHWEETGKSDGVIAERSEFFFAPSHIQKRYKDWGPEGFAEKTSAFLHDATLQSRDWLKVTPIDGLDDFAAIYPGVYAGRIPADEGLVIKL